MEYYQIAAKWWADKLRDVGLSSFQMGERDDPNAGMAMILGMMSIGRKGEEEDPANIDKFEEILSQTIKERVENYGSFYLSVDYGPDYALSQVATQAGLKAPAFPWKTGMKISAEEVRVSCGYGNPYVTIFPESEATT